MSGLDRSRPPGMNFLAALRRWMVSHPRLGALLMMGLLIGALGLAATSRSAAARTGLFLLIAAFFAVMQGFCPRRPWRRGGRPPHDLGDA